LSRSVAAIPPLRLCDLESPASPILISRTDPDRIASRGRSGKGCRTAQGRCRDVRRRLRAFGCDATRRRPTLPPPAAGCRDGSLPRGPRAPSLLCHCLLCSSQPAKTFCVHPDRQLELALAERLLHRRLCSRSNSRAARHDGRAQHGSGERLRYTGSSMLVHSARTADRA
jgi:hypothetical protein